MEFKLYYSHMDLMQSEKLYLEMLAYGQINDISPLNIVFIMSAKLW